MHVLTASEVRAADGRAMKEFGIPGLLLMEQAGLQVAKHVWRRLPSPGRSRVVVFAGKGNNGGDGLVAARHLCQWGVRVRVYGVHSPSKDSDAFRALDMARRAGVDVVPWKGAEARRASVHVATADVVVDALLGTGTVGPPREPVAEAIGVMNGGRKPVVSVDIPSGVDADTGAVPGAAVRAAETVTFGALKLGLLLGPGRFHAGRVTVADIGWPAGLSGSARHTWVTADVVRTALPTRAQDGHKGTFGRVLVVAGSRGMAGAGALCVRGAWRVGAGLVTLAAPESLHVVYATSLPEALTEALPQDDAGALAEDAAASVARAAVKADVIAVGPGLGTGAGARAVVERVLRDARVPVILDADGLNVAATMSELLEHTERAYPLVMTPHPGEMARLCGVRTSDVVKRPVEWARERAARWGAIVVLKGSPTVVAEPNGHVYVNGSGSAALAAGGTGDVLTGAVAGLLAQGASPAAGALAATYIHGLAGDMALAERQHRYRPWTGPLKGPLNDVSYADFDGLGANPATAGATASEVADALPAAMTAVHRGGEKGAPSHVVPRVARIFE